MQVPTPSQRSLSFCDGSPRGLRRWIAGLPKANIGETARQLYQALVELNQLQAPPESRLQLLEPLRPEVHFVCQQLERHFLNQSIVLDERPRKVANLCQALQNHLAVGYKLAIVGLLPRPTKDRAALLALALQRALHALYGLLVRASQLYCPAPEGLWLELHQLYRIACEHNLQHSLVRDELARHAAELGVQQTYVAALMLGCAGTNRMRQNSIARLAAALEPWSLRVKLQPGDQPDSLFVAAPQVDGPPRYRTLYGDGQLHQLIGIDPRPLVEALRDHLALTPDARSRSRLPEPEGVSLDLLQHLCSAWGEISARSAQRTAGQGTLTVCLGMSALHYHLAGGRVFAEVLKHPPQSRSTTFQPSHGTPDVWAKAFDAQPQERWDSALPFEEIQYQGLQAQQEQAPAGAAAEDFPTHALPIINHSPGGYCLSWPGEVPSQLQTGELLGIQAPPEQAWSVAVVRWIRQVRGGGTQMGVELLAPQAQPCGLQLVRKSEQGSQYLRALLLPENAALSRAASLITPRLPFEQGHKVQINLNGQELKALLSQRLTSTGSFSQFAYRTLRTPAQPSPPPAQAEDEDFDSLWKSL